MADLTARAYARLRQLLGTDHLPRINRKLDTLELAMADFLTLLNGLAAQSSEASAAQQASFLNIHNALNRQGQQIADLQQQLADAISAQGRVTPEMQAKADQIAESLADIRRGAETADDGFEPVEEPATEVPAEPEVPAVEEPTVEVPAEQPPAENARRR